MKRLLLVCCAILVCVAGCKKSTTIKTNEKDGSVIVTIPQDASAAELINMQTALSNSLTVKAERERQAFELQKMELKKEERQFYFFFGVFAVVAGIVAVFAVACLFVFLYFGRGKSWKK